MSLLKPSEKIKYTKGKYEIKESVLSDIMDYCEFAKIEYDRQSGDISEFIEKCMSEMIDIKDKDWKKYKKDRANGKTLNTETETNPRQ